MNGVAAQPRRVEARRQLGLPGSQRGAVQGLGGQRQAQQQQVGPFAVFQQQHHLRRPALVEQKVSVGGEQIAVGDVEFQRPAKGFLGQRELPAPLFNLSQPRQHPQALGGGGLRVARQGLAQRAGRSSGTAGQRFQLRRAARANQRRGQSRHLGAGAARLGVVCAHHVNGGLPGPGFTRVAVLLRGGLHIGQRGVELVAELQQHRAHHTHRQRRRGQVPPRGQGRLGIADVARVAFGRDLAVIGSGQRDGGGHVGRPGGKRAAQPPQLAHARIGGTGGQDFQDIGVAARLERRGSHPGAEQQQQAGKKANGELVQRY